MIKFFYIFIGILLVIIAILLIKQHLAKKRILNMSKILDDVLNGQENLYIFTDKHDFVAELAFETNKLISAYWKQRQGFEKEHNTKKELLSNLSHDVRTPLVSVIGYLEAVTQNRIPEKNKSDYIQTALQKSLTLKERVNQLFEFVQIDANEIFLSLEIIDICEILRQIVIDFIPYMEKENISLEIEITNESLFILADKSAIIRIFQNLIRNTIIHGKNGKYLGVFLSVDNNKVFVDIKDKGMGIDKDHIPFIFERLYKADNSRTQGGGLGLAIAKELAEKMNGTVEVLYSIPGDTVFRVSFPLSENIREMSDLYQYDVRTACYHKLGNKKEGKYDFKNK
ncbi:sensor histidine kinase [Vallitalea maricola]|uniref:HAMP domain-containing sensor histidine kinase n=1 Tax=Vallitalea maricola TaxID=3074433 RepID=A0ACB5UD20_9FIRM|nr:HAMP domain-containing sensor histidine kinase [Vallitalea sp. AN17-2]